MNGDLRAWWTRYGGRLVLVVLVVMVAVQTWRAWLYPQIFGAPHW